MLNGKKESNTTNIDESIPRCTNPVVERAADMDDGSVEIIEMTIRSGPISLNGLECLPSVIRTRIYSNEFLPSNRIYGKPLQASEWAGAFKRALARSLALCVPRKAYQIILQLIYLRSLPLSTLRTRIEWTRLGCERVCERELCRSVLHAYEQRLYRAYSWSQFVFYSWRQIQSTTHAVRSFRCRHVCVCSYLLYILFIHQLKICE